MSITEPQTATSSSVKATIKVGEPAKTGYVILRSVSQEGIDETWQKVATVPALSAQAAIRAHATAHQPKSSETFVAVPERSWRAKEVQVLAKTVISIKCGSA